MIFSWLRCLISLRFRRIPGNYHVLKKRSHPDAAVEWHGSTGHPVQQNANNKKGVVISIRKAESLLPVESSQYAIELNYC